MNVKDKTGPLVFVESVDPLSGRATIMAARFETIELDPEEAKNIRRQYLADVADVRLLWLRNYILSMCANTPHVIPDGTKSELPIETDDRDEGQQLGG